MAQILLHDRGTTMLLVVDDEPGVRSVLLELLNLTVIPVALLRMVATHSIALDATDVAQGNHPGLGHARARWLGISLRRSKDAGLASIPMIVVSAIPGIEKRAEAAGAQAVLRKPVDPKVLFSAVDRCLKQLSLCNQDRCFPRR
jgi:CheY-like chemotaxis protein